MERNGRFTFGWCISYRPFHNPPRKEVEAKIVMQRLQDMEFMQIRKQMLCLIWHWLI